MSLPLLQTTGLKKRYGNVTVLDDVDFDLRAGEIHALLGANGAGKSTLCKIIAGIVGATRGTIAIDDAAYQAKSKQDAERHGIEIVQQELNLIPTLNVAENLMLTQLPTTAGIIRNGELHQRAREILDRYGLSDVDSHQSVGTLGIGRQQMLEIAKALARDCKVLILDEPTAALSDAESRQLFDWLRELRARGVGIVYISHRLAEVAELTDRVTILRDGQLVGTHPTESLTTRQMVQLMSGDNAPSANETKFASHATKDFAFGAERLSAGPVKEVSFEVRRGERFGIAGLVGSGRTELLRAIFGADLADSGNVQVGEMSPTRYRSPDQAVAAGLAMVTEDRKQNGLLLTQSVRANTTLGSLSQLFSKCGIIRSRAEALATDKQIEAMETRCSDIEQQAGTLSGGNQQKVAIAKWLVRDAEVFLFDEPTRGIDVAARQRIHGLMESLAKQRKALIIVSSDLDELLATCDRIGVISNGRMVSTFLRGEWSKDAIMQASFTGYEKSTS